MIRSVVSVLFLFALGSAVEQGHSTVSDPEAPAIPADPNAALCWEVPVSPFDAPPPFGTVVRQWNLTMSGSYAGAGITWVRSQGRFYLMDQGYSGTCRMWSFDPENPAGTMRNENWVFPNFRTSTADVPWGVAWDNDSNCFWISQILDAAGGSNVYYGCLLLKMTPQGTWYGTARDSWLVGIGPSGSPGGPLSCYWLGGFEKWIDRGFFCGAPVAVSPSTGNYVVKFNPYTKTNLGRVAYGDLYSERGCALVPYDSLYVLTCGWNANAWRKRREDGYLLQQVSATVYGPADWAMWVPQTIVPTDTVYVYCINSNSTNTLQKISCGFTWGQLPAVGYKNVAPTAILAPVGAVDSGSVVVPLVTVANKGPKTVDSFDVYMRIGANYESRKVVRNLPGGTSASVSFSAWIPRERDSVSVTTFTWWKEDEARRDDTLRSRILSRVKDVAVTEILWPKDTLDSADVVTPECRVRNKGSATQTFDVRFKFGSYDDTVTVANLASGEYKNVSADKVWVAQSGAWLHRVEAVLPGDVRPDDNVRVDTFWVLGTPGKDVAAEGILSPGGRIKPGARVSPAARVVNYGGQRVTFLTCFSIWDNARDRLVFHQSRNVNLAGGAMTNVTFDDTCFNYIGPYTTRCSVYIDEDQNVTNDVVRGVFEVDPMAYAHNVGVKSIAAPLGTVDSGSSVTPTAVVTNTGLATETFTAYFTLPGYTGVANVVGLPAESSRVVQFPVWQVRAPRGTRSAAAWTLLPSDQYSGDDTLGVEFSIGAKDVGIERVLVPRGTIPADTSFYPECVVRNFGTSSVSFDVEFRIGTWADTARVENLAPGASDTAVMENAYTAVPGVWLSVASTLLPDDRMPDNNTAADTFRVPGVSEHDVGVQEILAPSGGLDTLTRVTPQARVANYGRSSETWWTFFKVYDQSVRGLVYSESLQVTLPGQTSLVREFPEAWFREPGTYVSRCSTFLATDQNWTNNTAVKQFDVGGSAAWKEGWKEVRAVPGLNSGRPVSDGGCLAIDGLGTIYALKGYKTCEFQAYDPIHNTWTTLESVPPVEAGQLKPPGKGACMVSDGGNYLYLVRGNNTLGFWRYDIGRNRWEPLEGIPSGGNKVKGGSDAVYVEKNDTGYVYLLKGGLNEFYRYNTRAERWDALTPAPYGGKPKYEKGSWICAVPPSGPVPVWWLYVHQAKYIANDRHYMFAYDLSSDSWVSQTVRGMPLAGLHGGGIKVKKSKDGGSAAEFGGHIYALKGGGTQQFFKYSPRGDAWEELDTVPRTGSGGKKWVKAGADIVSFGGGAFFALKGGKTAEMWRYVEKAQSASRCAPQAAGAQAETQAQPTVVRIVPNPPASRLATVRFASGAVPNRSGRNPEQSPSRVCVFDAAGKCVLIQAITEGKSPVTLDLRGIPAGVYMVRLESAGYSQTQKLVLQE